MNVCFDNPAPRYGTDAAKYAGLSGKAGELLPLWVADMDFPAPPEVIEALHSRVAHGIFGYGNPTDEAYFAPLRDWYKTRFGWRPEREWLVETPGVVFAVYNAIRALTAPNDAVLILEPVYYPFARAIRDNGRRVAVSRLVYENGRYSVDFDDFERTIENEGVKVFILCSPHNPVGRVFTQNELEQLTGFCEKHDLVVISDEIHSELVFEGHTHIPFFLVNDWAREHSITLTSGAKTYNIPCLPIGFAVIPNEALRHRYQTFIAGLSAVPNVLALEATRTAYNECLEWKAELLRHLQANRDFLVNLIELIV